MKCTLAPSTVWVAGRRLAFRHLLIFVVINSLKRGVMFRLGEVAERERRINMMENRGLQTHCTRDVLHQIFSSFH